jgi:cob(I)alamin adenosyltransferase
MSIKLYTRQGDDGSTGLFGGRRVPKDSPRVETFGTVDELNSALGLARAACGFEQINRVLDRLQSELFDLGANLCTPSDASRKHIPPITPAHIEWLESTIDELCAPLPPMRHFVLPGGCELAARLHLARCVCRRAERLVVSLSKLETLDALVIIYLNRLSDLLFAAARRANQLAGVEDVPWIADRSSDR